MGMGLIMVLLGAGYGELAGKLKGGAWMVWIKRALGVILLIPAAFYLGALVGFTDDRPVMMGEQRIEWLSSEKEALALARAEHKPVMMEFTASWCPPCQKLEDDFFSQAKIVGLGMMTAPLRVDASAETPQVRRLIQKYGVFGWPTVIFLAPDGRPMKELRVNDFNPEAIEEGLKEAICRTKGIKRSEPECEAIEGGELE